MESAACWEEHLKSESRFGTALASARQIALEFRFSNSRSFPEAFRPVSETSTLTPTLEHIKSLLTPHTVCLIAPVDIPDFGFVPCQQKSRTILIVHPSHAVDKAYLTDSCSLRTTILQYYFLQDYLPLRSHIDFSTLPKALKGHLFCLRRSRHAFTASYIFGDRHHFQRVARICHHDPLEIAKAYDVPYLYAMYELAYHDIDNFHFISYQNDNEYRSIGRNLETILKRPYDSLITRLKRLKPEYHGKLIYKETKVGNKSYMCIGITKNIRNKLRVHTFGADRNYFNDDAFHNLKNIGLRIKDSMIQ